MIPKVIHYCWFGKGDMPKLAQKCINSWEKYCPDYKIIEWNEQNFDITSNKYVYEAYQNKKYAFVTDYVRLYVMYKYGGIYMDTDVEVLSSLDIFLNNKAFSGFETQDYVPTGVMACEKEFELFGEFLAYYEDKSFVNNDGSLDMTSNVRIMTNILEKYGLNKNGEFQVINGFALYPMDYFCPLDNATGRLNKTANTATIHWFNKSWVDPIKRKRSKITRIFHLLFGKNCFSWLKKVVG
ncbi:glycosyltransferase [Neobacillus rhizosphaerae]|uniref:glycosyltransferase family 32 protein n=1 Tax=Neobacillus rhizosphaerae TaxID=2880965 RepID=UPI003D2880D7